MGEAGDMAVDEKAAEADEEEREWVKRLTSNPAAKNLLQHLSALECVMSIGGQELVEPPVEQCATWRRVIMSELERGQPMLGVKRADGGMPRCLAMTNLSGHHGAYYSESMSLAKVLCVSAQPVTRRFLEGVNAVCEKARQLDASVLVCFCCPFQYGLERLHWELRTVRKVGDEVVDGEMGFSSSDVRARPFPRTSATEHWTCELMAELKRKLFSVVSPLCLDTAGAQKQNMGPDRMQQMISMLQEERRRMIENNRECETRMREAHRKEKEMLTTQLAEAEASANARVAKVAEAAANSRKAAEAKELELTCRVSRCMGECVTQKAAVEDMTARLAGATLEREQEVKKHKAREETLQAQVRALSSSNAKAVAEHTKAMKTARDASRAESAGLCRRVKELEKQLSSTRAATGAVNAASEQLRKGNADLELRARRADSGSRAALAVLRLASIRHAHAMSTEALKLASAEADAKKRETLAAEHASFCLNERIASLNAEAEAAARGADERIAEATQECSALKARAKALATSLSDAQDTIAALKAENAQLSARAPAPAPPFAAPPPRPKKGNAGAMVPNGVANGVPYAPSPPGHFRGFGPDPALEACIAQLQASMEFVVASARSSCASAKSAELAHAKLEALSAHGIAQPAQFWPGYQIYGNCQ
tara:strand:+ start:4024 stop:5997 length:1974 start_codon:yes stop_codon:yes gene_type:complete